MNAVNDMHTDLMHTDHISEFDCAKIFFMLPV